MPPIIFVAKATGTLTVGALGYHRFNIPTETKPGDLMIAFTIADSTSDEPAPGINPSWEASYGGILHSQAGSGAATHVLYLWARQAQADDGATIDCIYDDAGATVLPAVLLVYRAANSTPEDEDFGDGVFLVSLANGVLTSTNWICPSQNAQAYSDLYIGACYVNLNTAVTNPAGTNERHEEQHVPSTTTLEVFDFYPEAAGATGTKTATTGSARSGVVMSLLVSASAMPPTKKIEFASAGAIGLPTQGV